MKFLIQTIDDKIVHDFSFELLRAIEFQKWKNNSHIDVEFKNNFDSFQEIYKFDKYIPIGTVEFVSLFLKNIYGITPKPYNVPESLLHNDFTQRKVININLNDENFFYTFEKEFGLDKDVWIKSNDIIKSEYNDWYKIENINIPAGNYQISEEIEIESEWRAFIFQDKLVGLKNYSGSFEIMPSPKNIELIKYAIKKWNPRPIAGTLDFGINEDKIFIIEAHDFFSCGLYGFSNYNILPAMFSQWFHEFIANCYS